MTATCLAIAAGFLVARHVRRPSIVFAVEVGGERRSRSWDVDSHEAALVAIERASYALATGEEPVELPGARLRSPPD